MSVQLEKPRWPGGPDICPNANLPALPTQSALKKFLSDNGPSCKVTKEWECSHCGHWHAHTIAPDPAGNSSGTGRGSKGK